MAYDQLVFQVDEELTSAKLNQLCANIDMLAVTTPKQFFTNVQYCTTTPQQPFPSNVTVGVSGNSNIVSIMGSVGFDSVPDANHPYHIFGVYYPTGLWTQPPVVSVTWHNLIVDKTNLATTLIHDNSTQRTLIAVYFADLVPRAIFGLCHVIAIGL